MINKTKSFSKNCKILRPIICQVKICDFLIDEQVQRTTSKYDIDTLTDRNLAHTKVYNDLGKKHAIAISHESNNVQYTQQQQHWKKRDFRRKMLKN